MNKTKILILLIVVALIGAFFWFDGQQYISVERFKDWVDENIITAALAYFALYVLVAALSLPGAAAIT